MIENYYTFFFLNDFIVNKTVEIQKQFTYEIDREIFHRGSTYANKHDFLIKAHRSPQNVSSLSKRSYATS